MGRTYTREVQVSGRNRWYRAFIDTYSVTNVNDTTARVSIGVALEAKYIAQYGVRLEAYVNGRCVAGQDVVLNNYGDWGRAATLAPLNVDVPRNGSSWNCSVQVRAYGKTVNGYGSAGGDVWATAYMGIPQRGYSKPNPPKGCSFARVSDNQQKLSWQGDYTGMDGAKPWAGVYVDRRTDDGNWVNIADLSWDVTNYTDNSTSANHKYDYRLCAHGPGGNSDHVACGTTYTTPAAPSKVEAVKTGNSSVRLVIHDAARYPQGHDAQRSTDGGKSWATFKGVHGTSGGRAVIDDPSAPAGSVVYRVRAYRTSPNGLNSGWKGSNSVMTVMPPKAPAVSGITASYATGSALTVKWTPNHPDGTKQSAAQVEITGPSTMTEDITGLQSSLTLRCNQKGSWRIRVRTKGLHSDWGAWSSYVPFVVADLPQAWVANPGVDGALVDSAPLNVEVSASDETGIASATLSLTRPDGTVVGSVDVTDLRPVPIGSYEALENGVTYTLTLNVRAGSGLTATARRTFKTHWSEPAVPVIEVTNDGSLSCHVMAKNGTSAYMVEDSTLLGPMAYEDGELSMLGTITFEDGELVLGDAAKCVSFDVERIMPDGTSSKVAGGILDAQEAIDRIPPLNTAFRYRVTGYAESGTSSRMEADAYMPSRGMALNFGVDGSDVLILNSGTYSQTSKRSVSTFHFADGGENGHLPASYPLDEQDVSTSASFDLLRSDYDAFRRIMESHWRGWWRGHCGERAYGPMEFQSSVKKPGVFSCSANVSHDVFEEPANG